MKMGFKEWFERKKELKKAENDAKADAMKAYYQSAAYKKAVSQVEIQKMKEGKTNDFSSWLKRVSQNAAVQLNNEHIDVDREKLFGKTNSKTKK